MLRTDLRADLALLTVAFLIAVGIIVLVALHDGIPPELWAIVFSALTGAGVAVQTQNSAAGSTYTVQQTGPKVIPPPPPSVAP